MFFGYANPESAAVSQVCGIIGSVGGGRAKMRDAIKLVEADGWYLVVQKGSYRQSSIPLSPVGSQLPDTQVTIWRKVR